MELYHGAHTEYQLHLGQCYTPSIASAISYASQGLDGEVAHIEVDMTGLTVIDVGDGYDRDENVAAGDDGRADADVLIYTDEDIRGMEHDTYRLMSQAAIERVKLISTEYADEIEG